ncbi:MAG: Holliday junction branch migration protein RuvA [Patescibacteria group bacterium]
MFGYIKGRVVDIGASKAVLETGGVGYTIHSTISNLSNIHLEKETQFWLYTAVRENDISLYGFATKEELRMFELLITVSGIGPRSALAILGVAGLNNLEEAIASGETLSLTKIAGVGKKTADKIVLELGGKINKKADSKTAKEDDDIFEALKSLGYRDKDIAETMKEMPQEIIGASERIKWALKTLGKN